MSHVIDVLRALVSQAATALPESNYALRHARRVLAEHDTIHAPDAAFVDKRRPWGATYDEVGGKSYARNRITGERGPLRSHLDSAIIDAQERNSATENSIFARPLLDFELVRLILNKARGSEEAETPKETRSRYTRYIHELSREQLEYLLRCLPVPTHAATVEALRGAAVNLFRWGTISIADIDEARKH